jgi:hypothetical protein
MTIDEFMAAISGRESGGNYNSVNKDSGASGRFQIMPGNWAAWSHEAGLPPNAPMTPQNQDLVARHKMMEYYNAFGGNWGAVAAAWYGGPKAGQAYLQNPNQAWLERGQGGGKYPSIDAYVQSVLGGKGAGGSVHGQSAPVPAAGTHQAAGTGQSSAAAPTFLPSLASSLQAPSMGLLGARQAASAPGSTPDQSARPDLANQLHASTIGNQAPDWAMNWNKGN